VPQGKSDRDGRTRVKTLMRDLQSLAEYSTAQSQKVTFLLDASLGMINIEQSRILGMFSVVAFVFLPPTLIASIYGMNFHSMPELDWEYGYPLAVVAMFVSAILPYLVFKRRGWL
jgi:magnesium transporter